MKLLVSNIGTTQPSGIAMNIGSQTIYSSSNTPITQPSSFDVPDFAAALNAWMTSHPSQTDVPIDFAVNGQADLMLTDLSLTPGTGIDLSVAPGDLSFGCPGASNCPASEGNSVAINVTIHNTGVQDATSAVVSYYAGDPNSGGRLIGSSYVPSVPAGGTATCALNWPTDGYAGQQTIYAVVNPAQSIQETDSANDKNNSTSQAIYVRTKSDLQVTDISPNPTDSVAGEAITATISVANSGETDARPSTTHVTLTGERGDNYTVNVATLAIPANSVVVVTAAFTPQQFGNYTFAAAANLGGLVTESDKTNNGLSVQTYVGLGPQLLDSGGSPDPLYTPSLGYGYLNGQTHSFADGSALHTARFDGNGQVQYHFDGLQSTRYYHLDATFYEEGDSLTQAVLLNGVDSGQSITLASGAATQVTIQLPPSAYADGSLTVSFKRIGSAGPAFVNQVELTPVAYRYVDSGGPNDNAYSAATGYGYVGDSYGSTLGGSDPISTYRTSFSGTVSYQFDGLSGAKKYTADITMYAGPSASWTQNVTAGGLTIPGCANLVVNDFNNSHWRCTLDPSSYPGGSVTIGVTCAGCPGPRLSEIALEQSTALMAARPIAQHEEIRDGGFETGGVWQWITAKKSAGASTAPTHSGKQAAMLCGYNLCADHLYQTISLLAGLSTARIGFWWRIHSVDRTACADTLRMIVRAGAAVLASAPVLCNTTPQKDVWRHTEVDLTIPLHRWAGKQVQVGFNGAGDKQTPTTFYVDDVSLSVTTASHATLDRETVMSGKQVTRGAPVGHGVSPSKVQRYPSRMCTLLSRRAGAAGAGPYATAKIQSKAGDCERRTAQ